MVRYIELSCGTTHRVEEFYDVKGYFLEKSSRVSTVKWYLDEVSITRGKANKIAVVHSMYDYVVAHAEWFREYPALFRVMLLKLIEFRREAEEEEDRRRFRQYFDKIYPREEALFNSEILDNDELYVRSHICKSEMQWISIDMFLLDFYEQTEYFLDAYGIDIVFTDTVHHVFFLYEGKTLLGCALIEYNLTEDTFTLIRLIVEEKYLERRLRELLMNIRQTLPKEFIAYDIYGKPTLLADLDGKRVEHPTKDVNVGFIFTPILKQ